MLNYIDILESPIKVEFYFIIIFLIPIDTSRQELFDKLLYIFKIFELDIGDLRGHGTIFINH